MSALPECRGCRRFDGSHDPGAGLAMAPGAGYCRARRRTVAYDAPACERYEERRRGPGMGFASGVAVGWIAAFLMLAVVLIAIGGARG